MKTENWILILIVAIILTCIGTALIFIHVNKPNQIIQVCPVCEVCPICEDCEKRIDYCFEKCSLYHTLLVDDQISKTCMWHCLNPDYNIVKID